LVADREQFVVHGSGRLRFQPLALMVGGDRVAYTALT
jgi:hypothetical protein